MKKTVLSIMVLASGTSVFAQRVMVPNTHVLKQRMMPDTRRAAPPAHGADRSVIWSDDFSVPSHWTIAHAPGAFNLDWQIGVGLVNQGGFPTPPIQSTTAANGYAMLDSDFGNNQTTTQESSWIENATPIDLTGHSNVVLQFQNNFRDFTGAQCYVAVSTNNTDWPALTNDTTGVSAMTNVWALFTNVPVNSSTSNPQTVSLNISAAVGGASTVYIRFWWTGLWDYSWFVDDAAILDQPQHDLVMDYGFTQITGTGEEYGRTPTSQLPAQMNVGGEVLNFGVGSQDNVTVNMEVRDTANALVFTSTQNLGTLASGATAQMNQNVTLPTLHQERYTATFNVTSDQIADEATPDDNSKVRTFRIDNAVFSLDEVGDHPTGTESLTSLGTASFTGGADNFIVMTYYPVIAPQQVPGVEFVITSTTAPGALVSVSLFDTTDVFAGNLAAPIVESDQYTITANDVSNGTVRVFFNGVQNVPVGGYYAAVKLSSGNNTNDISIIDDITVPEPNLASAIYIDADQVYTNGNASAVRMITDPTAGIAPLVGTRHISVYPNPTADQAIISTGGNDRFNVQVLNALGGTVLNDAFTGQYVLHLADQAKGVYTVRVYDRKCSFTQRVVLR